MMSVGINIYKRTDNLAESEPRMTSDWKGFQGGQLFEVPLHDNNQQYRNISTGLVRIQPGQMGESFVDWFFMNQLTDPAFPPFSYPHNSTYANLTSQYRIRLFSNSTQNRDLRCALHPNTDTSWIHLQTQFGVNFLHSGFETCFGPSTQGAGTKTHLKSRFCAILKKRGAV